MGSGSPDEGRQYEIVLGRRLGARSARSFEGFELLEIPGDGMLLRGVVADQAALHGTLARIRDLGIPLLAVRLAQPPADAGVERLPEAGDEGPADAGLAPPVPPRAAGPR